MKIGSLNSRTWGQIIVDDAVANQRDLNYRNTNGKHAKDAATSGMHLISREGVSDALTLPDTMLGSTKSLPSFQVIQRILIASTECLI